MIEARLRRSAVTTRSDRALEEKREEEEEGAIGCDRKNPG